MLEDWVYFEWVNINIGVGVGEGEGEVQAICCQNCLKVFQDFWLWL